MLPEIAKLASIGGDPIANPVTGARALQYLRKWGACGRDLAQLLEQKNGFYAYESSLLVRPLEHAVAPLGLVEWNSERLWKDKYAEDLPKVLFFAEDIFGCQFCFRRDSIICTFDPETGAIEEMTSSLTDWAKEILAEYDFRTGYPLAHAWQMENSPLPRGIRLLPKRPFVLGGKFEVENLYSLNEVEGMLFRSSISNQIRNLPEGSQVVIRVSSPPEAG
jgi:hypothetical protein